MRPRVTSVGLIVFPDTAIDFDYPAHIDRASLNALPRRAGVYLFRDRHGDPLYIGKSINIRGRVLSHLRTPEESDMLHESCRVDFIRTAGEIGALLLESRLVKQLQPAYNVRLKGDAESFALGLLPGAMRPQIFGYSQVDDYDELALYGLFASVQAAREGLEALIRSCSLCPGLMGLEARVHGRACFSHQIGRCRGACAGKESREAHDRRMLEGLVRIEAAVWPYAAPIGIVEQDDGWRQIHVIDRWAYLGTLEGRRKKIDRPARRAIDIDIYKILGASLRNHTLRISQCLVKKNAVYYCGEN